MIGYLRRRGNRLVPVVKVNSQLETLPPDTLIRVGDGLTTQMMTARQIERELTIPGGEAADWLRRSVLPHMIEEERVLDT